MHTAQAADSTNCLALFALLHILFGVVSISLQSFAYHGCVSAFICPFGHVKAQWAHHGRCVSVNVMSIKSMFDPFTRQVHL